VSNTAKIKPNGRPSKLTPETHKIIVEAVRAGLYYEDAANVAGICYDTLNNWRLRGEAEAERRQGRVKEGTRQWEKEEPYFQFFEALKRAEGSAIMGWMQKIETAANEGAWQAAAWKAERRYPERYGRHRVEHTGKDGDPIRSESTAKVEYTNLSDDELYDTLIGAVANIATISNGDDGKTGGGAGTPETGTDTDPLTNGQAE
jgi:hypothetical protein